MSKQCMSASLSKCRKRRKNTLAEYCWSVYGVQKRRRSKKRNCIVTGTQSNIIAVLSDQFSATSYHYYCNNSNIQKLIARTSCLIRSQFSQGPDKVDFGNDCLNGKHSRNIHVRIIVKVRASGYGSLKGQALYAWRSEPVDQFPSIGQTRIIHNRMYKITR